MLRLPALYSAMSCSIRSTRSCRVGFRRAADDRRCREAATRAARSRSACAQRTGRRARRSRSGQVDERIGVDAFCRSPDHVLLRSDGAVEQRIDRVGDRRRCRPFAAAEVERSARRARGSRRPSPGEAAATGSGSTALNSFRAWRAAARKARRDLVVDQQRLDGRVAQRDELEPRRVAQLVEVDVVALAQLGARRRPPPSSASTSAALSWIGESTRSSALAAP